MINSKDLQPRLLYPAKLSFRIKGKIKSIPGKKKLKEYVATKLALYECSRVFLKKKMKIKNMNKMAKIHIYQQLNLKKINKQAEEKQS